MPLPHVLSRDAIVAGPHYNRWLIVPAALAVHLSIGQAYSLSVFNLPMTQLIGIHSSAPGDWPLTTTVWIFNIAFAVLGLAAALFGKWLERVGPRCAMLCAALCFGGGLLVASVGVQLHEILLVYLGYGVIGGVGLGLGYISPVSTLIKWFPDRPGMATGLAIMGFGGGAMIGSPLATKLMAAYRTEASAGVAETFATMGVIYLLLMLVGAWIVRVPAAGWLPAGYVPATTAKKLVTNAHVSADEAVKTPQFWLVWVVLFLNVTAGIGVLSQASPMIQEMFSGRVTPADAAVFVSLLSVFNLLGRFVWASMSDWVGRKNTFAIFLGLGPILYIVLPHVGGLPSTAPFIICAAFIISMYGGGFATVPAYLRDLFGTFQVGAIHGRLLTAWSAAALVGPTVVTYIRESQLKDGIPKAEAYTVSMYIMAGLLVVGLLSNLAVKPVDARHQRAA